MEKAALAEGLHDALAIKLGQFKALDPEEVSVVLAMQRNRQRHGPHQVLVRAGQRFRPVMIVRDGWACVCKTVPGGRRQIIDFLVPGDVFGLGSGLLRKMDRDLVTVTEVEVAEISFQMLAATFRQWSRIASAMRWALARQAAIVQEHVVDIGQRSAPVRAAHLLLELGARVELVRRGTEAGFACPLTQHDLADALGLTAIHVNRTLRVLRERGLVAFQNGQVEFLDHAGLARFARFDRSYLDHLPA